MRRGDRRRGFTLIELIVTIVIMGIVMIPLGLISMEYMRGIVYSRDLAVAEGLAKTELAKISNLDYNHSTLEDGDDDTYSNYEGYAYDLRRTVNYVPGWNNNLKKVQVRAYLAGETATHLVNISTYIADASFGPGSAGGKLSGGDADYLVASGGSISGKNLQDITLENIIANNIIITGVRISFSGGPGIKLKKITIDSVERWSGNVASGASVTLDTSFTLTGNTVYTNAGLFEFSKNVSAVTDLVFIMSDASETEGYLW
ncbi:type II secretion system protein [Candidatus Omnitrophota bacterium]